MKKTIVIQNSNQNTRKTGDREDRLRKELRDNLKKRKAQARAQKETGKDG